MAEQWPGKEKEKTVSFGKEKEEIGSFYHESLID